MPPVFGRDRDPGVVAGLHQAGRGYPRVPLSRRPNPMVIAHGAADPARACGECRYLVAKHSGSSRTYYGCEKRGAMTSGPGTDHLVGWPACALFDERGAG